MASARARQRRQHTLEALTRLFVRESQVQPLLLHFEDLHWIDAETQAWLDVLVDSLPAARILLLVNYRPEYQHRWGSRTYYAQLRVDPLPRDSAEGLLLALLGDDAELAPLRALLIQRTEGNPFFLEESVQALAETKALVGERGAYRLAAITRATSKSRPRSRPSWPRGSTGSRPDEKRLLQSAAVVGKDVPFALLRAHHRCARGGRAPPAHRAASRGVPLRDAPVPRARVHVQARADPRGGLRRPAHERRRAIHARIVEEIERVHGDHLAEEAERLAHHAVRAELWEKALRYGREAGGKALARWALREAAASSSRPSTATAHLPESRQTIEQMVDVRLDLRTAHPPLGEVERSERLRARRPP